MSVKENFYFNLSTNSLENTYLRALHVSGTVSGTGNKKIRLIISLNSLSVSQLIAMWWTREKMGLGVETGSILVLILRGTGPLHFLICEIGIGIITPQDLTKDYLR